MPTVELIGDNAVKILTLIFTAITTLGLAILSYLTLRANLSAQEAARSANESAKAQMVVARAVAISSEVVDTKLNSIHTLVNSSHGIALLATVTALEEVLSLTKDPKRKAAVIERLALAKREYDAHQIKQSLADATAPKV